MHTCVQVAMPLLMLPYKLCSSLRINHVDTCTVERLVYALTSEVAVK